MSIIRIASLHMKSTRQFGSTIFAIFNTHTKMFHTKFVGM